MTVPDAYDHDHDARTDLGWIHSAGETEWDEIEADDFDKDGVQLELEVAEEDGRIVVELEIDEDRFYNGFFRLGPGS